MAVSIATPTAPARNTDRAFFTGMSLVILAIVFVGFMRTFFLSSYFGRPALSALRIVHGTAFTSWIVLFAVQSSLIAAGRRSLHRRLGYAGAVLAAVMVVLGIAMAITAAREGHAPPGLPPLGFLAIPLFDMLTFAPLVALAVYRRRVADTHKRLMLLATLSILAAAVARIPGVQEHGNPLIYFGVVDLLILAGVVYDRMTRGAVHRVYKRGGALLVISQAVRLALVMNPLWQSFARTLTGT
jgi:hypothetical protein